MFSVDMKNRKNKFFIFVMILLVLSLGAFWLFKVFVSAEENGDLLYENGKYQKAASAYKKALFVRQTQYCLVKIVKSDMQLSILQEINNILTDITLCYSESGDIKKAIDAYSDLEIITENPVFEAFSNYVKLQKALCYSYLGYYGKTLEILEPLKSWYPQYLAAAYLDTGDFEKAREILFSDDIQNKLSSGDDLDTAFLNYVLQEYYKAVGDYSAAAKNYAPEVPPFESEIMEKVLLADLYFKTGEFEKSAKYYENLVDNPEFSQRVQNKMKIRYSLTLAKMGRLTQAKELLDDVLSSLSESYRLSPDIICTKYYLSTFDDKDGGKYLKEAKNLFAQLHLNKNSIFYKNLDEFCRINTKY